MFKLILNSKSIFIKFILLILFFSVITLFMKAKSSIIHEIFSVINFRAGSDNKNIRTFKKRYFAYLLRSFLCLSQETIALKTSISESMFSSLLDNTFEMSFNSNSKNEEESTNIGKQRSINCKGGLDAFEELNR